MGIEDFNLIRRDSFSAYQKLYAPGVDIYKILNEVKVETPLNQPCYDLDGNPKDGSVKANEPNVICISVANLKDKLNANNFESETAALILHEISHLLETSEDEAGLIQRNFISQTQGVSFKSFQERAFSAMVDFDFIRSDIARMGRSLPTGKLSCNETKTFGVKFAMSANTVRDDEAKLSLMRDPEYVYQSIDKFTSVADFLCSLPEVGNSVENKFYAEKYELGFGGQTRVPATIYASQSVGKQRSGTRSKNVLWLEKLSSVEAASKELDSLANDMLQVAADFARLSRREFQIVQ